VIKRWAGSGSSFRQRRSGSTRPRPEQRRPGGRGVEKGSLIGAANVRDKQYHNERPDTKEWEPWDDGYTAHGPVGKWMPNAFGLQDTAGNELRAGTDSLRVFRGGSWYGEARYARSATRQGCPPEPRSPSVGVRPARAIER